MPAGHRRRVGDADHGREAAQRLGLVKPRAAVTHFAVMGDDPVMMLTAVMPATRRLLKRPA
jgi:acetyl-CoA acetyltransferase